MPLEGSAAKCRIQGRRRFIGREILKARGNKILYLEMNRIGTTRERFCSCSILENYHRKRLRRILKMTPENVRVLSYRAKRELRVYMEENNYDLS